MEWPDHQLMRDVVSVRGKTSGGERSFGVHRPVGDKIHYTPSRSTSKIKEEFQSLAAAVCCILYLFVNVRLSCCLVENVQCTLFVRPEWSNVLIPVELLFSLPASNGKLEWVFSQLIVIKINKRTSVINESFDNLLFLTEENNTAQNLIVQ